MYQTDLSAKLRDHAEAAGSPGLLGVEPNVWKLGFTSLFTDVSAEMVSSILPLYFVIYLGFSPLQFGVLDGIYQGAAVASLSLVAGIAADRWRRQKEVAVGGYGFSAISKLGLLAVGGSWTLTAAVLVLDRVGKSIRTAPRDAMISLSTNPRTMATAFAVHRALDTGGSVFGPLLAFLLLAMAPGAFTFVLLVSFCIALVGLGLITLLVEKPGTSDSDANQAASTIRQSLGLWNEPSFRTIMVAGGILAFMTASDAFIYLVLQKNTGCSTTAFPLFAFITAVAYLLLAVPAGKLADAWGRRKVFLGGYVFVFLVYLILLLPELGKGAQFASLGLLGAYYAATNGVLAAVASSAVAPNLRTSGLAFLNTVLGICKLLSSVLFGLLWTSGAMRTPVWVFSLGMMVAFVVSAWILSDKKIAWAACKGCFGCKRCGKRY
jgi:predicted MFS family arabinose efflux permease